MIFIDVNGQSVFVKNPTVVEESIKYLKVRFKFTEDWLNFGKTAIFKSADGTVVQAALNEKSPLYAGENSFFVPFEVIKAPYFSVAVLGETEESRITTESARVEVSVSGVEEGDEPSEPTPDIYSQLISISEKTLQEAKKSSVYAEQAEESAKNALQSQENAKQSEENAKASAQSAVAAASKVELIEKELNNPESTENKVTEITEQSSDKEYPSAKAVYNELSGKLGNSGVQKITDGVLTVDDTSGDSNGAFRHEVSLDGVKYRAGFWANSDGAPQIRSTQIEDGKENYLNSLTLERDKSVFLKPIDFVDNEKAGVTAKESRLQTRKNLGIESEILFEGSGRNMNLSSQSIAVEKTLSQLNKGLVFVFAYYHTDGTSNMEYQTRFVDKTTLLAVMEANDSSFTKGLRFDLSYNNFEIVGSKRLFLLPTDTTNGIADADKTFKIAGITENGNTGTAASGISYQNNRFVLKKIIAV